MALVLPLLIAVAVLVSGCGAASSFAAGERVRLTVISGGREREVGLSLGERPRTELRVAEAAVRLSTRREDARGRRLLVVPDVFQGHLQDLVYVAVGQGVVDLLAAAAVLD